VTSEGTFVLADIGGYTTFLSEVGIEHAKEITSHLFNGMVKLNQRRWKVGNVVGDCLFLYTDSRESPDDFFAHLRGLYEHFRTSIAEIASGSTCRCGACDRSGDLALKFVVHTGEFDTQQIAGRQELIGPEIVVAHRLLKNSVPLREYALLTTPLADVAQASGLPVSPGRDEYQDIGAVEYVYLDLQPVREAFDKKLPLKIGTTPPGGSDEWVMRKIFEFYKTSYNDVRSRGGKVIFVSYSDLVTQFRDRNADILVPNLAVPAAALQEASLGRKMRILPMDEDLLKYLEQFGLSRGVIPKGSYKDVVNNDRDIPTIAMANTIVANAKIAPADAIYQFTKLLLANVDGVRKVHPAFKDFDPKDAVRLGNVPLHPGAERAYKEAGLLK